MKLPTIKSTVLTGTLMACTLSALGTQHAAVAAQPNSKKAQSMTPEVKLVEDYNNWYFTRILDQSWLGDLETLKAGLPKYITNKTVLHEPASLPWGGTDVGYDGWVHLTEVSAPALSKLAPLVDVTDTKNYQQGNVVFHEMTITIKGTKEAPEPLVLGAIEKYTLENHRIARLDVFFTDTALFVERLIALGVISKPNR